MTNLLPPNTEPEFFFFQRFRYDFHLVFKCHDETNSFASRSEAAYTRRERQVCDFMHGLQKALGLRRKEMIFFGSTEFGKSNRGHIHLLISFDGLRAKGKTQQIERANELIGSLIERGREGTFQRKIRIGHEPINSGANDQKLMLSYVCKGENEHAYKHFIFPSWIAKSEFETSKKAANI